jgi:hypothetical protein
MWAEKLQECKGGSTKVMITKVKGQIEPSLFDL